MMIKDFENIIEVVKKLPSNDDDDDQFEHFSLKIMENNINITTQVTLELDKEQQKEWQIKIKKLSDVFLIYQLKRRSRSYVYDDDGVMVEYNKIENKWIPTENLPTLIEMLPTNELSLSVFDIINSKVKIIRKGIDITDKIEIIIT